MTEKMKHAEVIKAWVDGAELECRLSFSSNWISPAKIKEINPITWPDLDWRVKPVETSVSFVSGSLFKLVERDLIYMLTHDHNSKWCLTCLNTGIIFDNDHSELHINKNHSLTINEVRSLAKPLHELNRNLVPISKNKVNNIFKQLLNAS